MGLSLSRTWRVCKAGHPVGANAQLYVPEGGVNAVIHTERQGEIHACNNSEGCRASGMTSAGRLSRAAASRKAPRVSVSGTAIALFCLLNFCPSGPITNGVCK